MMIVIGYVVCLACLVFMWLYARDMRLGWMKEAKISKHWIDSYKAMVECRDRAVRDIELIAAEKNGVIAAHARALEAMGPVKADNFALSEKLREANGRVLLAERRVGPLQNDNAKLRERAESAENAHNKLSYDYDKLRQELNKLKLEVKVTT